MEYQKSTVGSSSTKPHRSWWSSASRDRRRLPPPLAGRQTWACCRSSSSEQRPSSGTISRNCFTGEMVAAYALSESGSGSDALAAKTRAVKQPDGSWQLTGREDVDHQRRIRGHDHRLRPGRRRQVHRVHRREELSGRQLRQGGAQDGAPWLIDDADPVAGGADPRRERSRRDWSRPQGRV